MNLSFNILDNTNIVSRVQEALISLRAHRANKTVNICTYKTLPKDNKLLIEPITLQYTLGFKQFPAGTIFELIGGDGIGKTTLVFTLMGMFLRNANAPCLFINSEGTNKRLDDDRMASCISTSKNEAFKYLETITMAPGSALKETLEDADEWIKSMRTKVGVPMDVPLVVAIDTISKLVPPSEAKALGFGDAKKAKGLGESSNLEFSKLLHEWTRSRATFLSENNVFMIIVSHQNESINMSSFGSTAFIPEEVKTANNKTKIGGRALNQSAAVQASITKIKGIKSSDGNKVESHLIKFKVLKNSLGPDGRECTYRLRKENLKDTDTEFEPAIDFYSSIAELFAENEILDTTESRKRYTCEVLELFNLSAYEFGKAIQSNKEILNKVGELLKIKGYSSPSLQKSILSEVDNLDSAIQESSKEDTSNIESIPLEEDALQENISTNEVKKRGRKPKVKLDEE